MKSSRISLMAGSAVLAAAMVTPAWAQMTVNVGGRLQVDAAWYDDEDVDIGDGSEFRRARLFAAGDIAENWSYKAQYDFANNDVSTKDLYVRYSGFDFGKITFGQFKQEFSLEELTSSKYITFMERAQMNALTTGRRIGIGLAGDSGDWHYAFSAYQQEEGNDSQGGSGDAGNGVGGRVTWGPKFGNNQLHFGVAGAWEEPENDSDEELRIRERPESHYTNTRLVDTGVISEVDDFYRIGVEAAGLFGPFSVQGEWAQQSVSLDGGQSDPDFSGWYVYGSWFITGESRAYKGGKFGRTKASNAWEVAVRFSNLDLEDGDVDGGDADNWTIGVNYYFNPFLRVMFNYVNSDVDNSPTDFGDDEEVDVFQTRLSMDFK